MRRDLAPVRLYLDFLEKVLLPLPIRWGLSPDHVTAIGLALSVMAGLAYLFSPVAAGLLALLSGLCDSMDGLLARRLGRAGQRGAFLDSVLDRYGESCLLVGMWVWISRDPGLATPAALAAFAALVGSFMISYTRARGEGLNLEYRRGFLTRDERLVVIVIGSLADPLAPGRVLFLTLILLALGTNLAALHRFRGIFLRLPETDPQPDVSTPEPPEPESM
ncbi:MAG: CDP-alcohol phosphatidyltransferase family protein [Proteobacteria bacterium]|nr:CDP-alcohol phosphatidyltransferase family protein [Pseudomonadota bacterium]